MHDDAVHEVSKAPGMELSGTGTMVVAVVKCKLVELCLTSAFAPGKPKLPEQSWLIKLIPAVRVTELEIPVRPPRRAAQYNQL